MFDNSTLYGSTLEKKLVRFNKEVFEIKLFIKIKLCSGFFKSKWIHHGNWGYEEKNKLTPLGKKKRL